MFTQSVAILAQILTSWYSALFFDELVHCQMSFERGCGICGALIRHEVPFFYGQCVPVGTHHFFITTAFDNGGEGRVRNAELRGHLQTK